MSGFGSVQKISSSNTAAGGVFQHSQNEIVMVFIDAGFRPGSRDPFVSAKGPNTIDAQFGLIKMIGRKAQEGGQTRYIQTMPTHYQSVHPKIRTAGVGRWKEREMKFHVAKIACLGLWYVTPFRQRRLENLGAVAQICSYRQCQIRLRGHSRADVRVTQITPLKPVVGGHKWTSSLPQDSWHRIHSQPQIYHEARNLTPCMTPCIIYSTFAG